MIDKKKIKFFLWCLFYPWLGIKKNYWLYKHSENNFFRSIIRKRMGAKFTVYISKEAKIKSDLEMPHPYSIVIGKGVSIGENCKIFQNVTIGISDSSKFEHIKEDKDALSLEYPSIGNNVVIYSGAKIFGGITINNNVVIGAGSVVNKSIPSNTVVAGNPAKIIKSLNKKT